MHGPMIAVPQICMFATLMCILYYASIGAEKTLLMILPWNVQVQAMAFVFTHSMMVSCCIFSRKRTVLSLKPALVCAAFPNGAGQRLMCLFRPCVSSKSKNCMCKSCMITYYPCNVHELCNRCLDRDRIKEKQSNRDGLELARPRKKQLNSSKRENNTFNGVHHRV